MNHGEKLRVYQIYYKPEQIEKIEYLPYFNPDADVFLENSVIKKLIEKGAHSDAEYFGVVSHKLREKIGVMQNNWRNHPNIASKTTTAFCQEELLRLLTELSPDVMSLQCHMPHDPITFANKFHPQFAHWFRIIMAEIGYYWKPEQFNDVFYCNFFVAKSEIYERYVNEMLSPAMEVMKKIPDLHKNSRYPHKLPPETAFRFGYDHFPYHPFLCERMFSYFAHVHKLKCLHY
jgi:hypothetical protein